MQEQYLTTQIGILSEALKNLQASVNALSVSEPEEDFVIGGTTIDQASQLYSIFTAQDVAGVKELKETELLFNKSGNISLLYINDSANNNIPLQFSVLQDNVDNNNNSVTISVDNITSAPITLKGNKVGINILNPEEELEVDGSIQIDSASVARLKFQYSGENPHKLAEIDGEQDGIDGGDLQFYTKVDGGNLTEKLRINNVGAIGIGGASYGSPGQVLTSNGSGNPVSWSTPSGGGGGNVLLDEDFTTPGIMTTDGSGIYSTIINNSENWNAAHSWGDHSIQGYLTDVNIADVLLDEDFTTPGIMTTDGSGIYSTIINNSENWNAAHSWGDHSIQGYLTDVNIADVLLDEDFTTPGIMTTDGSGIYSTIINNSENWNAAHSWGNHADEGYLTDVNIADVLLDEDFTTSGIMATDGSGTYSIITDNSANWNTAYSWGDHSIQGYLTDVNIADVLLDEDFTTPGIMTTDGSGIYSTIINNSENWNAAHSWGDHSIQGYLTDVNIADVLLDEDFTTPGIMTTDGSGIYSTIINNSENWNAAHSWGNHADEGYLTDVNIADVLLDEDFTTSGIMATDGSGTYSIITDNSANWNTAYSWGDHSIQGYLTDVNIADVLLDEDFTTSGIMATDGSGTYSIITDNSANWNTAYSWGDHSIQGYLTDVSSQTLAQLQDVKLTNLTTNDLLKYDGTNFVNFSPTYLDGSGIADNFLIKIVNNQTETTLFKETVQGTSTLLESHVADGVLLQPAGSIKSEFDGIKSKMHLYSGISGTSGITVTSEGKVGINKLDPEEELEVDGSIQIDSANVARLKFQKSGQNPHALAEIDGELDGLDGGDLQFFTKIDGGNLTEKLRISELGAIGIGGSNFGTSGQVLTSNGSNSSVSWTTPSGGGGGGNLINLSVQGVTNKKKQIPYTITKTITASDITARLDHAPSKEQVYTFGESFLLENQWIAVGQGTNTIAYSRNGIDWTGLGASVFTTAGNAVVWSGSSWVAVGQGTNTLAQSADGVNWNGLGASIFSNAGNKVNTNGTLFVAVGSGTNSIAYATFYWTGIGTSIFTNGYDVCFNGERWVAVGDGANTIAYSADGINWTGLGNIIFTSGRAIAWNGNLFVAGGVGSNTLAWSYDGISWNTTPPNNTLFGVVVRSLAWNGEKFLAFGAGTHTIGYSTNGIDWTGLGTSVFANNGRGATWNGAYWVAVGDQNNTLAWSRDGISWIPLGTSIFSGYGYGIAYNYRRPNTITFPANNKTGTVNIPSGSITLNSTTLDIIGDSYNNFGYTNFAMSIS